MKASRLSFAVYFRNRGFFPACHQRAAREKMRRVIEASGYGRPMMDASRTGYGADECILFHCGPAPRSLTAAKGSISDRLILANAVGPGFAADNVAASVEEVFVKNLGYETLKV